MRKYWSYSITTMGGESLCHMTEEHVRRIDTPSSIMLFPRHDHFHVMDSKSLHVGHNYNIILVVN